MNILTFYFVRKNMQIYLVGGAVRDKLLNRSVEERDWVVVGATPEALLQQGYKPVGKSFPVFLHPKTNEEYALARTERKVSKGYQGFEFCASPDVSLEEDLKRRDLTVNAMAQMPDGSIVDPFDGQKDLKAKVLRHVSSAFSEDPVRVLRVARFSARLCNFTVADETLLLMQKMVRSGEVDALVPERVWKELQRALTEKCPERFIEVLRQCHALKIIFPEVDALFGVLEPIKWHPEQDAGFHTLLALKQAVKLTEDPVTRFAVLVHDFGKAVSPKETLPKHHRHDENGVKIVKQFCKRLNSPREYRDLGVLVARYHMLCHKVKELTPKVLLNMLQALDPFRRPERFEKFLTACQADSLGREGAEEETYFQADYLRAAYKACASLDIPKLINERKTNQSIEDVIYQARLSKLKQFIKAAKEKNNDDL